MSELPAVAGHRPESVLRFWFDELDPADHFNGGNRVDAAIAERFSTLLDGLEAAAYPHAWEATPDGALALLIALDQFQRNLHRGGARAFLLDAIALDVAQRAIGQGYLERLPQARRKWLLMPLMHSEDLGVQEASIPLFTEHTDPDTLAHAKAHRDAIARFGRFPGRNAALGRDTTAAERDYLEGGGYRGDLAAHMA